MTKGVLFPAAGMEWPDHSLTTREIAVFRSLPDFDFEMVLAQTHEFGWVSRGHKFAGGKFLLATAALSVLNEAFMPYFGRSEYDHDDIVAYSKWLLGA
jgi:hypothetical protein